MKNKTLTQQGLEDSVRGKARVAKGRVQDAVGSLTGDATLQSKGLINRAAGKLQDAVGKMERAGDKKVGRKR